MSSIDFFGFPIVVLREMFSQLGFTEIFNISLCSKRSQRNVQLLMPRGNYLHLSLEVSKPMVFELFLQRPNESPLLRIEVIESSEHMLERAGGHGFLDIINVDGHSVLTSFIDGSACFFGIATFKNVTRHIMKVFRCPIQELTLGKMPSSRMVIDWVMADQESVKKMWIKSKGGQDEDISYVLNKAKVTDALACTVKFTESQYEIQVNPVSVKNFLNFRAGWMTVNHLLVLDIERGTLNKSVLTSVDINTFLKHWVLGGCSRLQELSVELGERLHHEEVLSDIDFEPIPEDELNFYSSKLRNLDLSRYRGYKIRRESDGKVAAVIYNEESLTEFRLFVEE